MKDKQEDALYKDVKFDDPNSLSDKEKEDIDREIFEDDEIFELEDFFRSNCAHFELEIFNKPNIKFFGYQIASVSSKGKQNNCERWKELEIYKTYGGRYIAYFVGRSSIKNEITKQKYKICNSLDEVKDFFGYDWLAKELYKQAHIDCSINID